ncbi:MAG: hypothetical protein JNL38_22545 [Myxococcales bacterium]|nr:hypothetical protein [Myxococcales bacterium]
MVSRTLLAITLALTAAACGSASPEGAGDPSPPAVDADGAPSGGDVMPSDPGLPVPLKVPGPKVKDTKARVWVVDANWADTDTPKARAAGVAWPADSGLSWEQKYGRWLSSFEIVGSAGDPDHQTLRAKTPYGDRTFDGPVLECADVAIWLRVAFASWYGLPYYATGTRSGKPIYMGHFGVVDEDGDPVSGFPAYETAYPSYEGKWSPGQAWPSDAALRGKHVGDDDGSPGVRAADRTLGASDGAGAYYDAMFLNKRVGHLLVLMDASFGSMHLAAGTNMYHVTPESTRAGDVLVERWQKSGVGHTLVVVRADFRSKESLRLDAVSGGMPRHQPDWAAGYVAMPYFTAPAAGGPGFADDDPKTPLAQLGGGLRRFRVAVVEGGRWMGTVLDADRASYISETEVERIAARTSRFVDLLGPNTPDEARAATLANVDAARKDLMRQPASCSARERREQAFAELYDVMSASFGKSKRDVDAEHRKLEDYVFAELEYGKSKTCCWSSATREMATIVLDYAKKEKAQADAQGVCKQPTPFRATAGGYGVWKSHAATLGKASAWRAWSEDEPCPQRGVQDDVLTAVGATPMCK